MVFPIQRMSTIQNGIGIQHPQPRPRKTQEAVKIGARRVLHHYQQYCVVPLRKENRVATRLLQQPVKTNTEALNLKFGVIAQ